MTTRQTAETKVEAQRRVRDAIESGATIVDPPHSRDEGGFTGKSRLYVYVHARRTGAVPGGPINPRNPSDCADAIIAAHAAGRKWATNETQIAFFVNRSVHMSASATGTDGIPFPFDAGGPETPLHTLFGDAGKRACARFITPDGCVVRRIADARKEAPESPAEPAPFDGDQLEVNAILPEEVVDSQTLFEGALRQVTVNAYERNAEARSKCIEVHGPTCCICRFNFGEVYGPEAEGYIHVHHVRPLSEVGEEYIVDPIEDLRPVCPNCHAVVHLGGECRSIEEVRQLLTKQK